MLTPVTDRHGLRRMRPGSPWVLTVTPAAGCARPHREPLPPEQTLPLLLGSSLSPEGGTEVSSWKIEARGWKRWQVFKGLARPSYLGHLGEVPLATRYW